MKGRKPKPTELKILHGSRQPINKDEPKPTTSPPEPAEWFTDEQRAEWDELLECMADVNILTKNDRGLLIRLACAKAAYVEAQRALDDGEFVHTGVDRDGNEHTVQNRWVPIRRDLSMECLKLEAELGVFSPTARTRVKAPPKPTEVDPKAEKAKRLFGRLQDLKK